MKQILLALAALSLAGCYSPRSIDSYNSTFKDQPPAPNQGDPYSFGGIAGANGGQKARTSYATDGKTYDAREATKTGRAAIVEPSGPPSGSGPEVEPAKGSDPKPQHS